MRQGAGCEQCAPGRVSGIVGWKLGVDVLPNYDTTYFCSEGLCKICGLTASEDGNRRRQEDQSMWRFKTKTRQTIRATYNYNSNRGAAQYNQQRRKMAQSSQQ